MSISLSSLAIREMLGKAAMSFILGSVHLMLIAVSIVTERSFSLTSKMFSNMNPKLIRVGEQDEA